MKPILIFDYDGTIHNTIEIYEPCFRKTHKWLIENGYCPDTEVPLSRIRSWLGINSKDMWNDFLPDLPDPIKEKASRMTGQNMIDAIASKKAVWYDGAAGVLDTLRERDYEMYVLSNCKTAYKNINFVTFDMKKWFRDFIDCESYNWAKKTEIVKDFMKKHPGEYIVIGDRDKDIECARACNGLSIGCLYGFGSKEELKTADHLITDISCLTDILR